MSKQLFILGIAWFIVNGASAQSLMEVCSEVQVAEGGDTAACACMEAEANGDAALEVELAKLGALAVEDRYDAASDQAKAVLDACFPN